MRTIRITEGRIKFKLVLAPHARLTWTFERRRKYAITRKYRLMESIWPSSSFLPASHFIHGMDFLHKRTREGTAHTSPSARQVLSAGASGQRALRGASEAWIGSMQRVHGRLHGLGGMAWPSMQKYDVVIEARLAGNEPERSYVSHGQHSL